MIASADHSGSTPARVELKIDSHPANLRDVRKKIEDFAKSIGIATEVADAIGLVLNEALANVMRHGYEGATDRPILVTAEHVNGEFRLFIRDWAKPFDPAKVKEKIQGDLTPGGLGLVCIKKLMDNVKYERLNDGMLLSMVKKTTKS